VDRIDWQVLLPDQPAAHSRQQLAGDFTAAARERLGEGPPCRIEPFRFALADPAPGWLWIGEKSVDVMSRSSVFSDDSGLRLTIIDHRSNRSASRRFANYPRRSLQSTHGCVESALERDLMVEVWRAVEALRAVEFGR